MDTWSFFDSKTGSVHPALYTGAEEHLALNTPNGTTPIRRVLNHTLHWVDPVTLEVHERVIPLDPAIAVIRDAARVSEVRQLESQQLRPLRALLLNPNDKIAREKLQQLEAQIQSLGIRAGQTQADIR